MLNGPITLTTDFGLDDHFVGTMKGVILNIAPKVHIIDISHAIPAYNITEASFVIGQAWRYFPKRTIHVVIIDPGVGTSRRPILAEAGGQYFIAPDNGVLSMIYDSGAHKVRVITNHKFMLDQISRTFHGRDVFAPAAAHLASGATPAQFGQQIQDYVKAWESKPVEIRPNTWRGTILKVDHFGNLITNFHIDRFGAIKTSPFELRAGDTSVRRLALNYAESELSDLFVIVGSSGYLEIAANQASAAARLGMSAGASVELEISAARRRLKR